jgi:hypothetical protein
MEFEKFSQLFYITHLDNLNSIVEKGILSHSRAQELSHKRIDMQEVQELRKSKQVPGGRMLHHYANLYFSARNPMMYKRKDEHKELCVLRVKKEVLDIPGVVVTSGNAASEYISFHPPKEGIAKLDGSAVFAINWTDEDAIVANRKRVAKCAEVLIPDCVPPALIFGAYVSCTDNVVELTKKFPNLNIEPKPVIFFIDER